MEIKMTSRRQLLIGLTGMSAAWRANHAHGASGDDAASRTYCLKNSKTKRKVCTAERVPSAETEARAKQFRSTPEALTVYLVRYSWVDAVRPLTITLNDSTHIDTLPRSLIWMRLKPGTHLLSFEWDGKTRRHRFEGGAGEVKFIEVAGSSTPVNPIYHWSDLDARGAMVRARECTLVAEIAQWPMVSG